MSFFPISLLYFLFSSPFTSSSPFFLLFHIFPASLFFFFLFPLLHWFLLSFHFYFFQTSVYGPSLTPSCPCLSIPFFSFPLLFPKFACFHYSPRFLSFDLIYFPPLSSLLPIFPCLVLSLAFSPSPVSTPSVLCLRDNNWGLSLVKHSAQCSRPSPPLQLLSVPSREVSL